HLAHNFASLSLFWPFAMNLPGRGCKMYATPQAVSWLEPEEKVLAQGPDGGLRKHLLSSADDSPLQRVGAFMSGASTAIALCPALPCGDTDFAQSGVAMAQPGRETYCGRALAGLRDA